MGGSSTNSGGVRRTGAAPRPEGPASEDRCPVRFRAVVTGPAAGIVAGSWLEVQLQPTSPSRVIFVDVSSGSIVGSLTAVPNLDLFIDCLRDHRYRAYVDGVVGGRVDVTVVKQ